MTLPTTLIASVLVRPSLVVAAGVAIILGLRRTTAAARHAVWAGVLLATLALPLLSIALPPLRIQRLGAAIERFFPQSSLGRQPATLTAAATPVIAVVPSGTVAVDQQRPGPRRPSLPQSLMSIWFVGAAFLGARRLAAELRMRKVVRQSRPAGQRLTRLCAELAGAMGTKLPTVLLSDETASPAVTGVLRPVVLLPIDAEAWSHDDLNAVFTHELAHVAERDCLLNACADVAVAIYWCNPLVRLAARRMRAESENASDDRVLGTGADPEKYANLLLNFARSARMSGALPQAATAMARPSELESRLLAVLDSRIVRTPPRRWAAISLVALSAVIAFPIAAITLRPLPLDAAQPTLPEPDQTDSVASPASERLPLSPEAYRLSPAAMEALAGPDSILAMAMAAALDHRPSSNADLIRDRAAWTLSQARNGRLIEPLLDALESHDWRVQSYAAWALATAREPRAVTALIPLMHHPVWRVRAMAAFGLRVMPDRRSHDAMNAALTDPAWQVRVEAVDYFAALHEPAQSERLRARLDDRHVAVRLAAARATTTH